MKKATRFFSIVMVLAIICGLLSACGGTVEQGGTATPTADPNAMVWVPSFKDLPSEIDYFNSACVAGDYIYIAATAERTITVDGPADPMNGASETTITSSGGSEYVPVIYKIAVDGTSETLPDYKAFSPAEEGQHGSANLSGLAVDSQGNLWVGESCYLYHYEDGDGNPTDDEENGKYVDDGAKYALRKLSPTGAELLSVDISAIAADMPYFSMDNMVLDAKDNIYFNSSSEQSSIYVYDSEGKELFALTDLDWVRNLVRLADGNVAAGLYDQGGFALKTIDVAKKGWGESCAVEQSGTIFTGSGKYLFLYNDYSSSLYGWDAEKGEGVKILDWLDCDMDIDSPRAVVMREDGTILCVCSANTGGESGLATLTETPASQVAQKTTLTMACMYMDSNVRSQVLKFNRQSETSRIQVLDYSQYNTEGDYSAGMTKLNTEIMSGSVPDILDVSSLPVKQYAAKGLLADLYPLIDGDSELERGDFVQGIMKAMEIDGHLYQASSDFGIMTIMGRKDIVGEGSGWTLEEMMDCYNSMPEGSTLFQNGINQSDMLQFMCYMNLDRFVNYETGECSFDSDGFIDILKFCAQFPATYEYQEGESDTEAIGTGKQMLIIDTVYDYSGVQMYEAMFGGEIVYKGFPTSSGSGSVAFVSSGLAISESCADKEAAWSFVRNFLTEDFQKENVWNFPTNQKAFDAQREQAMKKQYDADGNEISTGGMGWDDFYIELYAVTEEQAGRIQALIDSVDGVMNMDDSIFQILKADAEAFFTGSKTAEDVAKAIQSKVSIYVNEQK